jgi:ParE toxin of type II toxin-antitoxin system, parDE
MQLGDNPLAFPLVPRHEHSGIRRRAFGNYLIFHLLEADTVHIVHILHGAQDYEALRISSTNSFGCSKAAKRGRVRRRLSYASPVLATTRKRAECGAQFLDEYGGLLKGREMSAVGGFVPIEESRIDPLAPQSRR